MQFVRPLVGSVAAVVTACALFAAIPASNAEWTDTKEGEISITFDVPDAPSAADNRSDSAKEKGKPDGKQSPSAQESARKEQGESPVLTPEASPPPTTAASEEAAAPNDSSKEESDASVAP